MIKRYELFTTEVCPKCHLLKEFLKDSTLEGKNINASTDEGLQKAAEKNISVIPTMILFDEQGKEINKVHSVDELKKALEEQR